MLEARAAALGGVIIAWDAVRLAFVFDEERLERALDLATRCRVPLGELAPDTTGDERGWRIGIAQGRLEPFAPDGSRGALAWGTPLVAATLLADAAKAGEILASQALKALRSGALLSSGMRVARDEGIEIRGARLDPRAPWRRQAVEKLSQMRTAPLVGAKAASAPEPGALVVLRADPGTGGTRWLSEVATRASGGARDESSGPRALFVSPSGSAYEPLGALRRAFARSMTRELSPLLLELADPLEALLAGQGIGLEHAARLITAFLWPKTEAQGPGVIVIDDTKSIDPATLEACVLAARAERATFGIVARLDATSGIPSMLAGMAKTSEIELAPLTRDAAEALAGGCTNDALDADARKRWARLAANVPLAIVESVAYGIVTGDIAFEAGTNDAWVARPRSRASGRGKVRGATDWILLRARDESPDCRTLLALVAMLGGEAKVSRLVRVLEVAGQKMDVEAVLEELIRGRWVVDTQEDWVGFPSRTHREALSTGLLEESARAPLHRAAADVIEEEEGVFGCVEAAWHASQVGEGSRAAKMLLAAAKATASARLEASTTQLIAFARRADPSCEEAAMELLANALSRAPSVPPPLSRAPASRRGSVPRMMASIVPAPAPVPREARAETQASTAGVVSPDDLAPFEVEGHDSEPPTIAKLELAPFAEGAPPSEQVPRDPSAVSSGADIASRLASLAKEALLSADNAALERWVDGLKAAGESPMFTERLRALSRLGRGDIGDALRVLRRTRASLDPRDQKLRCQTSLALGVALSVAGRPQEALLEGMEALARARQTGDERGAQACLAFLAKLFAGQGRDEGSKLRSPIAP
ncbi:MAG: hypothetical protein JST00_04240 [Deltaproteobacteria bacterium]|nr:hypothetical protein [Deltaproteobacteria bacterium]